MKVFSISENAQTSDLHLGTLVPGTVRVQVQYCKVLQSWAGKKIPQHAIRFFWAGIRLNTITIHISKP